MATAIIMPDFGTTVEQVKLLRWLKAVGDPVKRGDMLCEIETDKATSELESIAEGILLKQVVPEGEDVQQGTVIAYVGAAGEVLPAASTGGASGTQGEVLPAVSTGGASGTQGRASGIQAAAANSRELTAPGAAPKTAALGLAQRASRP